MSNQRLAWHLLRFSLGLNIALHGLVRLPHLSAFVAVTAKEFESTVLPMPLVLAFCWTLPLLEAATGLWLLSGLKARWCLAFGSLVMVSLEFGTALRSDWMTLGAQMVYSLLYFVLLFTCADRPREFEAPRQTDS